jgi:formylglycine-generating enzyme required for sulfatase activity
MPRMRLSGSFIQYQAEMLNWPPATWGSVLDKMKELRMDTLIVQMLAQEYNDGTVHSFIGAAGVPDATETILNYADANGFKVYLGLYLPNWNHDMTGSNFLFETQTRMAVVAQQAWDRYLAGGRHPSFAGWYLPYESWTGAYQPVEVERLRRFFQAVDAACGLVSGEKPLAISPFISSYRPSPCEVENLYRQLLDRTGIDILLLQDSVGAQQWDRDIRQRTAPYFQALQKACKATGVQFWANLESFQISNGVFGPGTATRLQQQFDAAAPHVEKFITFDFVHYMNPVAFLSWWDQARRDQMRQFYSDYKAAFVTKDYHPLAPPEISASLAEDRLHLKWEGAAEDKFQLQIKTNLAETTWSTAALPILTNATEFSVIDPAFGSQSSRYYRVRRLPRLQVPDTMISVPPGNFLMGTPTTDLNKTPSELSSFPVTLTRGFWISQHEVTQSEYQNLTCTNPAVFATHLENPVENVTWSNAMRYCELLTRQERQAGRLPDEYLYRLPTEAEWEYAARAGTTNRFTFGDEPALLSDYGWHTGNSQGTSHPVGLKQANAWDLKDMHGNVLEWCWDWIASTPVTPVVDIRGSTTGLIHAIRGGSWSLSWSSCRLGWRNGISSGARSSNVGFRIVLAPASL